MSEKRRKCEAQVLKAATALASRVADELAECTGVAWIVTPDVDFLSWTLSFRCPDAPSDCIAVQDTMFSGLWSLLTDEYSLNWIVHRITDSVLSNCFQKRLHGCCRALGWKGYGEHSPWLHEESPKIGDPPPEFAETEIEEG